MENEYRQTNKSYAKEAEQKPEFHPLAVFCKAAGIPVTKRQASKWRMKKGLAYSKRVMA